MSSFHHFFKHFTPHASARFLRRVAPIIGFIERYFGYEVIGLEKIPLQGPALVVMNHGVLPFHVFFLVQEIFSKLGIVPRTLGARFLFQIPFVSDFVLKGGALNASRWNAESLLKDGKIVLVAPGGIYEALLAHPGMKRIPWGKHYGFVEVACKMKVPIIPTYCHGINEVYLNSRLFLSERIKILHKIWFSLPFFFGIGLLPFPVKLTHWVGKPISTKIKRGESKRRAILRIHHEVLEAMRLLRDRSDRRHPFHVAPE